MSRAARNVNQGDYSSIDAVPITKEHAPPAELDKTIENPGNQLYVTKLKPPRLCICHFAYLFSYACVTSFSFCRQAKSKLYSRR